jgi:hypothetical protein
MGTANTVGFQLPEQGSPLSDIERQDLEREAKEAEINKMSPELEWVKERFG